MIKKPEGLDMATIIEGSISNYATVQIDQADGVTAALSYRAEHAPTLAGAIVAAVGLDPRKVFAGELPDLEPANFSALPAAVRSTTRPALPPRGDDVVELLLLGSGQLPGPAVDALGVQPDPEGALFPVIDLVIPGKFVARPDIGSHLGEPLQSFRALLGAPKGRLRP